MSHKRMLKAHAQEMVEDDQRMRLFRSIWESLSPERRQRFRKAVQDLHSAQNEIALSTEFLLAAPNVATCWEEQREAWSYAPETRTQAAKEIIRYRRDAFATPWELLAAMDAWEAGEEYLPPSHDQKRMNAYDAAPSADPPEKP